MATDIDPPNLQLSGPALRLLNRANRMRILREALVAAGEEWIAKYLPERFHRGYAVGQLGYVTSQRRSRLASRNGGYQDQAGNPTSEGLTYDEKKQNLQGHDDPLVWTGKLRQQVFEQARVTATAVRGTEDQVRGQITFGRLAVGGPGNYRALPELIRRTLVTLPQAEREAITAWYQRHVLERLRGLDPSAKRLPPAPGVIADRRTVRDTARASALSDAMMRRGQVTRFVRSRRQRLSSTHESWRVQSGGSAPTGDIARSPAEQRQAHRLQSRASYYRNHTRTLARRRARYRIRNSTTARIARRMLGLA